MLNLNKLYALINKLPVGVQLENRLEQEINKQKQLFNNALKKRGLNADDPNITPQQKSKIEQAKISHTVGLYKEMSQGLAGCVKEIQNRMSLEGPTAESKAQLIAVQKQLEQISSKMGAYAKALQEDQKTRNAELVKQKEFDKRFIEIERKKEKEKELLKEREKAQEWKLLLGMLMPESWQKSWEAKTEERLNSLEKEVDHGRKIPIVERSLEKQERSVGVVKKEAVGLLRVLFEKSSIGGEKVEKQALPMTEAVKLRKEREAEQVASLHKKTPK